MVRSGLMQYNLYNWLNMGDPKVSEESTVMEPLIGERMNNMEWDAVS